MGDTTMPTDVERKTWFTQRAKAGGYEFSCANVSKDGYPRPENVDPAIYGHFIQIRMEKNGIAWWGFRSRESMEKFQHDLEKGLIPK